MNVQFNIPVTAPLKRGQTPEHLGDLEIDAIVIPHTRDDVDLDYRSIMWQGVNILPVLETFKECDDMMQMIHGVTTEHAFDKLKEPMQ